MTNIKYKESQTSSARGADQLGTYTTRSRSWSRDYQITNRAHVKVETETGTSRFQIKRPDEPLGHAAAVVPFVNGRCHFHDNFFTINEFFSTKLKKKEILSVTHPASNPEPLFPGVPLTALIPLYYQVGPPNLWNATFSNINGRFSQTIK